MERIRYYATCIRTPSGFKGTIHEYGVKRWVREAETVEALASRLRAIVPNLDHVLTKDDGIQDTGCLTLAECLDAISWK